MSNFSFEAYALDSPQLEYVNPIRYKSDFDKALHVVFPLDYFVDELRLQQEALLGGFSNNKRTVDPVCGEVMLDLAGTAQGNWFTEGSGYANQLGSLALVRDNIDPHLAAISVGGLVTEPGFWLFAPQPSGLVNRDFSAIRADGEVYCYEELTATPASYTISGHFLLQMISESELLLEWQSGSCGAVSEFDNPVRYER